MDTYNSCKEHLVELGVITNYGREISPQEERESARLEDAKESTGLSIRTLEGLVGHKLIEGWTEYRGAAGFKYRITRPGLAELREILESLSENPSEEVWSFLHRHESQEADLLELLREHLDLPG